MTYQLLPPPLVGLEPASWERVSVPDSTTTSPWFTSAPVACFVLSTVPVPASEESVSVRLPPSSTVMVPLPVREVLGIGERVARQVERDGLAVRDGDVLGHVLGELDSAVVRAPGVDGVRD